MSGRSFTLDKVQTALFLFLSLSDPESRWEHSIDTFCVTVVRKPDENDNLVRTGDAIFVLWQRMTRKRHFARKTDALYRADRLF